MSDGGIALAMAWGYDQNELARTVLVKPGWLKKLRERRAELFGRRTNKEIEASLGEPPTYRRDERKIADLAWDWNGYVDWTWNYQLAVGGDGPRAARERRKAGFTEKLTPKQWLKVRGEMVKVKIPKENYTDEIWQEIIEGLMGFLTGGELPNGFSMEERKPALDHRVAGNIVWYLQQVIGVLPDEGIDICSECGRVILTDSETHDWCSECGMVRCDSCTTAPYHCECDYPCEKHCRCGPDPDEVGDDEDAPAGGSERT